MTHHHYNLVPEEEGEVGPHEPDTDKDDEEEPPALEEGESSDDETYVDEKIEDVELSYDELNVKTDPIESAEAKRQQTRSGRRI